MHAKGIAAFSKQGGKYYGNGSTAQSYSNERKPSVGCYNWPAGKIF
jgi:hypothetical protein